MEARPWNDWPMARGTWKEIVGEPIRIEVYADHEFPDYAALYLCFANGTRQPARTVSPEPWEHWESVLSAWATRAPMVDLRACKEPPLPMDIPNWQI